jgi:hypothetical protein
MAACRSAIEWKTPRRMRCRVILGKEVLDGIEPGGRGRGALIADLGAKGAEPTATHVDPPPADPPPLMTGMKLTVRIWEETKQAMRAVPALRQVPQVWVRNVEAEGGTRDDALRFWAIALAGLVAAPLIGLGMRAGFDRRIVVAPGLGSRLRAAFLCPGRLSSCTHGTG